MDIRQHNQDVIDYYDGRVKKTMTPTGNLYTQHHLDHLQQTAGIRAGDRVLDVGCGMGRYSIPLAARGVRVEGIDLSPFLLERLQEYNTSGRTSRRTASTSSITRPRWKAPTTRRSASSSCTTCTISRAASTAVTRVVKPGGVIAFIEPNAYNLLYYVQILITPTMTWKGDKGMARMRPGVIFPAMRAAGLDSLALHRFGFFPPFAANTPSGMRLERRLEKVPLWRPLLPAALVHGAQAVGARDLTAAGRSP